MRAGAILASAGVRGLTVLAQEHAELWKRFYAIYRQLNGSGRPPDEK